MSYQTFVLRECTGAVGDNIFSLPFQYRKRSDVKVFVDGSERAFGTFTFTTPSSITLPDTAASLAGKTVRVGRDTEIEQPAATFQRGSLDHRDLNKNAVQALFSLQEAHEELETTTSTAAGAAAGLDFLQSLTQEQVARLNQRMTEVLAALGGAGQPGPIPPRGTGVVYVEDHFLPIDSDYTNAYVRAHAALPARGGVIVMANAPHSISGTQITFTKMVQLLGQGWEEGPIVGGGTWVSRTSLTAGFKFTGAVSRGGSIRGCAFYDTLHPAFGVGWAPADYVPAIDIFDTFGEVEVDQVLFANCKRGISCVQSGRLKLGRISGQFFEYAAFVDKAFDCPYIGTIHAWPYATSNQYALAYMIANLDVLRLGRVDTPFIGDIFSIYARSTVRLMKSPDTGLGGFNFATRCTIRKIQGDHTAQALVIDDDVVAATCNVFDLDAQGENPATPGSGIAGSNGLRIGGSYNRVHVTRLRTDIHGGPSLAVFGPGNWLAVVDPWFGSWDMDGAGNPAIYAAGSVTDINQVHLGESVKFNNGANTNYTLATNAIVECGGLAFWNTGGRAPTSGNWLDNGNFSVNQREVSGTVTLSAGAFGHDRWKAGAGGATYTFATDAEGNTVITLTAGSLVQVINRTGNFQGTHMLSWFGTAKARVNGGSWVRGPWPVALSGGLNTIEFGKDSGGTYPVTIATARLESGLVPRRFEQRHIRERLDDCQFYFQRFKAAENGEVAFSGYQAAGAYLQMPVTLLRRMRGAPATTQFGTWNYSNVTGPTLLFNNTPTHVVVSVQATATGSLSAIAQAGAGLGISADI